MIFILFLLFVSVISKELPNLVWTRVHDLIQLTPGDPHPQKVWQIEIDFTIKADFKPEINDTFHFFLPNVLIVYTSDLSINEEPIFEIASGNNENAIAFCTISDKISTGANATDIQCQITTDVSKLVEQLDLTGTLKIPFSFDANGFYTFQAAEPSNLSAGTNLFDFGPGFQKEIYFSAGPLFKPKEIFDHHVDPLFSLFPLDNLGSFLSQYLSASCGSSRITSWQATFDFPDAPTSNPGEEICQFLQVGIVDDLNDFDVPYWTSVLEDADRRCESTTVSFSFNKTLPENARYYVFYSGRGVRNQLNIGNYYSEVVRCSNGSVHSNIYNYIAAKQTANTAVGYYSIIESQAFSSFTSTKANNSDVSFTPSVLTTIATSPLTYDNSSQRHTAFVTTGSTIPSFSTSFTPSSSVPTETDKTLPGSVSTPVVISTQPLVTFTGVSTTFTTKQTTSAGLGIIKTTLNPSTNNGITVLVIVETPTDQSDTTESQYFQPLESTEHTTKVLPGYIPLFSTQNSPIGHLSTLTTSPSNVPGTSVSDSRSTISVLTFTAITSTKPPKIVTGGACINSATSFIYLLFYLL